MKACLVCGRMNSSQIFICDHCQKIILKKESARLQEEKCRVVTAQVREMCEAMAADPASGCHAALPADVEKVIREMCSLVEEAPKIFAALYEVLRTIMRLVRACLASERASRPRESSGVELSEPAADGFTVV